MRLHEHVGGIVIAQVHGELTIGVEPLLGRQLNDLWGRPGLRALVVDVAEVSFCDSIGLGELIGVYNRCQVHQISFALAGAAGMLARLLDITGLHAVFATFPDAAVAAERLAADSEAER
ncbi:STAS domain-containing protein [Planobispora siamensis]|uniref:Anti-sigma factor antagonist n=1 Tax=Planobispora siamensis TaxID=936338 RepID=A0A8J3WIY7_9ACTN|nr:STAS domain-containing protein [Planobispora siamensis]GIH91068.1 hypothetical protein Psi01_16980 [Planobispora siamensis]